MLKSLTYFIAFAISANVFAAEWYLTGVAPNSFGYIDKSSIKTKGTIKSYWIMQIYLDPTSSGYDNLKIHRLLNCRDMMMTDDYVLTYYQNKPLEAGSAPSEWRPIPPDSNVEKNAKQICSGKFSGTPIKNIDVVTEQERIRDFRAHQN